MSKNIVKPKSVSFEDALRNLASRLTGHPADNLPRTQEGIVQFMAENVPSLDALAEAITQEVFARMTKGLEAGQEPAEEAQNSADEAVGAFTPTAVEKPKKPAEEGAEKSKGTRKTTKARADN